MTAGPHRAPELRRDLGLSEAVGIGLGAVTGAGLFVVTGTAAGVAGPAFLAGLTIAGIAASLNGLSAAQLAATYPESGGTYEYGRLMIGPAAGFAAGWMFLASKLAAAGTVALGFGHSVAALFPQPSPLLPLLAAAAAVLVLMLANLAGIRKAGILNLGIVAITLLALAVYTAAMVPAFDPARLRPFAPHGWRGAAESAALLFFAYTGYARLATLGGEVRDPARTIPCAIILTLTFSFMIYAAVSLVTLGGIGAEAMAATRTPLQRAADSLASRAAARLLAVGACTALLGVLLSQILGISRMMLAMARQGDLPAFLGTVHPLRRVPSRAILLTGAIILLLAAAGRLEAIIAAASFTILIYYGLTNWAALRLRPAARRYPVWVSWAGLALCAAMALSLQPATILTGAGILAAGFLFRFLFRQLRLDRRQ